MNLPDSDSRLTPWIKIASILILASCLATIPSMAYIPLFPAIKETIVMNYSQVGLFSGLAGVLAIVCSVPAGIAIKRFGARKVCLAGFVFIIAGLLVLSFSRDYPSALSGRGVWQIGLRFLLPALTAALVVAVPEKYRSTTLGLNLSVSMIGIIIALNMGAWLNESFGWQTAIQFFSVIVFCGASILYFLYREDVYSSGVSLKAEKPDILLSDEKPRSVYSMPSIWFLCLLVIFACEEGMSDNFTVFQMNDVWGTDSMEFAGISSVGLILALFFNPGAGWCADKFGRWNVLILCGILNSIAGICLLVGQFGNKPVYIAGILIAKMLQLTTIFLVNSMAPTFLGGRDVGPIIAIIALGAGLGQFLGPQIIGILRDLTNGYTAGWIYIIASGIIATLFSLGFKNIKANTTQRR